MQLKQPRSLKPIKLAKLKKNYKSKSSKSRIEMLLPCLKFMSLPGIFGTQMNKIPLVGIQSMKILQINGGNPVQKNFVQGLSKQ